MEPNDSGKFQGHTPLELRGKPGKGLFQQPMNADERR